MTGVTSIVTGVPGLRLVPAASRDAWTVKPIVTPLALFTFAAGVTECEVETTARKSYRGYRFAKTDRAVALAADALSRCGFEPRYGLSGGAADANVFNERGLQCVNLANGMAEIHTSNEHIAVADLEAMVDVTLALVDAALA